MAPGYKLAGGIWPNAAARAALASGAALGAGGWCGAAAAAWDATGSKRWLRAGTKRLQPTENAAAPRWAQAFDLPWAATAAMAAAISAWSPR